jgi:hypothetical protein
MLKCRRETFGIVRIVCRNGDAGLLCLREAKYVVHPGVRRRVCSGLRVRLSARSLALRTGGGDMVAGGSKALAGSESVMTWDKTSGRVAGSVLKQCC